MFEYTNDIVRVQHICTVIDNTYCPSHIYTYLYVLLTKLILVGTIFPRYYTLYNTVSTTCTGCLFLGNVIFRFAEQTELLHVVTKKCIFTSFIAIVLYDKTIFKNSGHNIYSI